MTDILHDLPIAAPVVARVFAAVSTPAGLDRWWSLRAIEHDRVSSYGWGMYPRLPRRTVETGDVVPYAQRLDV